MSIERLTLAIAAGLLLIVAGCRGGLSIVGPPETPLIQVIHAPSRGIYRIYAPPDSLDSGSAVVVDGAGTHSEVTAETDGGLLLEVPDSLSASAATSQLANFTISYVKSGVAGTASISASQVIALEARVTKPLFSTGAGPNDMVFGNDSLYVANSFDNTVVRYGLDGEVLGTASFGEYASPSYLGLNGDYLYVVCNGSNQVVAVDAAELEPSDPAQEYTLTAAELPAPLDPIIYLGPSQPIIVEGIVCIPQTNITAFGPPQTEYFASRCTCIELAAGDLQLFDEFMLEGKNAQFGVFDEQAGNLYIVSTGPISFDEEWHPFTTGPSYLTIHGYIVYGNGERMFYMQQSISLGRIGAGRIALDPARTVAALGNSLNGNLYIANLPERTVLRGADNPIVLTEDFTYISDVAYTPDGRYVLATSFNTDELYVIDAHTDTVSPGPYPEPFDLRLDPELMAGVANVEVDPAPRADGGYDVYVLYGVANAVAKIELF